MIELVAMAQSIGVWAVLAIGFMAIVWLIARSNFSSVAADSQQQQIVTQIALRQHERAIKLEDSRYSILVEMSKLRSRLATLEQEVKAIPELREKVQTLTTQLEEVSKERDHYRTLYHESVVSETRLQGRVQSLESNISRLENTIRRIDDASPENSFFDDRDGDPVRSGDDGSGADADGDGDSASFGSWGGRDFGGDERDGDLAA